VFYLKRIIVCTFIFLIFILSTLVFSTSETIPAAEADARPSETLLAVGDLSFANIETSVINNPDRPWVNVKNILSSGNILVGNQEVPFSTRGAIYTPKKWTLRSDPRSVQALVHAGFKVVTLANNHMMDYGPLGLQDTLETLDNAKILHTGAGANLNAAREAVFYTTPSGIRFAFLAYSLVLPDLFWANSTRPGTAYGAPSYFVADVKRAKTMADYVVVSFHWSDELKYYPADYQKIYGKQCIDAGASIVLGHHPHVLQGLEIYHGGLIAYSLGNFAFGTLSNNVKDSMILGVDYDRNGLIQAKIYPININNYEVNFQPRLRHGADAERVLQELRTYSSAFQTKIESQGDMGIIKIRQ
jgi:poly-gamma-glutamate capsule biosynthesis protein CapA/YwtB (metallophosphatase superfamily)